MMDQIVAEGFAELEKSLVATTIAVQSLQQLCREVGFCPCISPVVFRLPLLGVSRRHISSEVRLSYKK